MSKQVPDEVVDQLRDVFIPLTQLVESLNHLEPGGTLKDDLAVESKRYGKVSISFCKKPLILNIKQGNKTYILKVVE